MPFFDLLIDTNVFVHASNGKEKRQGDSIGLIEYLLSSTENICVDDGFSWDDSNNSLIGAEYKKHLSHGMLGYHCVTALLQSQRIIEYSRSCPPHISKKINQCISNKKQRDKTFLKIAINSFEKILVSHDFEDFHQNKRDYINRTFSVRIIEAKEILSS